MSDDKFSWLGEDELRELIEKYGRTMPVISVVNTEPGSGKSTLIAHMAAAALAGGTESVVAIDMAARSSLAHWWNRRRAGKPALSSYTGAGKLSAILGRLRDMGVKLCLIDTPSAANDMVEQAIAAASIVVIPCRPRRKDLDAVREVAVVAHYLEKKCIFVVNSALPKTRMTEAIAVELSKLGTLAPTPIHRRPAFAKAMEEGRVMAEVEGEERAAKEIATVWEYLQERLERMRS